MGLFSANNETKFGPFQTTNLRVEIWAKANTEGAVPISFELELELIQTQMAQKPMLRAEVGMRVRRANKASAE